MTGRPSMRRCAFRLPSALSSSVRAFSAAAQASVGFLPLEDGERPVAHQLQHLAARLLNGGYHRIGIVVQHRNDLFRIDRIRYVREVGEVGKPECRRNAIAPPPW